VESLGRWAVWNRILGFLLAVVNSAAMFFGFLWNLPSLIRDYSRLRRVSRM
jgi:hypothetical protein